MQPPSPEAIRQIAERCDRRWDYYYTRSKLSTDPVYSAVADELIAVPLPVLDIGCGMGLLSHYLRACGLAQRVTGFDFDERKIRSAREMALRGSLADVAFHCGDAISGLPDFSGSVVLLDVLQYLSSDAQMRLLRKAAARVPVGGKLVIRAGLADASWRYRVTVLGDWIARLTCWMKIAPRVYPSGAAIGKLLSEEGFDIRLLPLWGKTPFNNYLIVGKRGVD